ncbi:chorismate synthase [Paludicola sp. MB14-C6]|uniref:chorismate synthase n=1 Tax=Paludihabitans sp. MB14-C6 TaxID=3070656 RepID=UPI0027DBA3EF|nr:chorismate synthase [Paludicola sp. MB14-C6]WMJ22522.1 chorismate synthase [Paludicola sp. MB14-C6]
MKSCFGNNLNISLFGESHSEAIGVVINGLAPGIKLDLTFIQKQLDMRKPKGKISTQRQEEDEFKIVSGFFNGYTTGTPLCLLIYNKSQHSKDYEATKSLMRPSHADYTAQMKYQGFQDYRGGGHFSGRITAPLVAAGAICIQVLKQKGILIGTQIQSCGGIANEPLSEDEATLKQQIEKLNESYFPVLNEEVKVKMIEAIEKAQTEGDSVGGVLETTILNMPAGIGEPFFNSIESTLSQLLFSIPGIKGVEFGAGFAMQNMRGSEANDSFFYNETVKTKSNNNGGINGGISNGMPIRIKCAVKPTPSIFKPQQTVDINTNENTTFRIQGRHDPAIIHRARVVVDSIVAIGLLDLFCERYGYLWMTE